jgi:hypothetical protein
VAMTKEQRNAKARARYHAKKAQSRQMVVYKPKAVKVEDAG